MEGCFFFALNEDVLTWSSNKLANPSCGGLSHAQSSLRGVQVTSQILVKRPALWGWEVERPQTTDRSNFHELQMAPELFTTGRRLQRPVCITKNVLT